MRTFTRVLVSTVPLVPLAPCALAFTRSASRRSFFRQLPYRARFLVAFPFRDAEQFAGPGECPSGQAEALHFHCNRVLTAIWAARLSQVQGRRPSPLVFSREDEKRRADNKLFAKGTGSILAQEQADQKHGALLADPRSPGVRAA
jgi:hypothetical protein